MAAPIRVLIADDHQLFVDGISEIIANLKGIQVVATANDGAGALQKLREVACDVAVLDIQMPRLNGLETTRLIQKDFPATRVLILTMNNEFSLIKNLLGAGALGYILKTANKEELERAIRRVEAGLTYFGEAVAAEMAQQYMPQPPAASVQPAAADEPAVVLSEREKEIVALIAREYTSAQIGDLLFIAPSTVDTHRKNVMQKLGVKKIAGLVRFALRQHLID
jgi:DNA-binding NarL/FixJ family response regulator